MSTTREPTICAPALQLLHVQPCWDGNHLRLLRDINFIEVGNELHPLLHLFALFWLSIAFGVFLASYLGPLWDDDGWVEEAICWIASCPADLSRFNGNDIHELKYTIALGGLLLYLIFEFLAGMKKFGFIVINIPLGGTDRGTYSSYMGTTPFFIRLPINH
eukprot:SAG31_NODE_14345_length_812_cov_1.015428_1_plen_160_part_01